MNLIFGICWIEDQASEAEIEAVEAAVRAAGFEPDVRRIAAEDEIRAFAKQQEHFQDYDLILLDLRLGNGLRGNELAPEIRQSFRSTPILFYSAVAENDLRMMMAEKHIDGAYCAHRDRLSVRVGELVSDLSPALNRLSGMRGLSARVVAECDHELRTILVRLAGANGTAAEIASSLKSRVRSTAESQQQRIDGIEELAELLDDHAISSGALFMEVRDLIRAGASTDEVRAVLRSIRDFPNDVLKRRNILAHALEDRRENGWTITYDKGRKVLTVADFERYRQGFLSQLSRLRHLRMLLISE